MQIKDVAYKIEFSNKILIKLKLNSNKNVVQIKDLASEEKNQQLQDTKINTNHSKQQLKEK